MNIITWKCVKKLFTKPIINQRTVRYYVNFYPEDLAFMSHREIMHQYSKVKKNAKKNFKTNPSHVTLQILGSGTRGVPSSLFVSANHSKYIFNCGEGSQRLAHEHHLRFGKLDNIFFTTPSWKNIGGLPGMSLTLQDMGIPDITVHGPPGIVDLFDAVRHFVLLPYLTVNETNCNESDCYNDACMAVRYVHLKTTTPDDDSDSDDAVFDDNTDYYAHETNGNGKRCANKQRPAGQISKEIVKRLKRGKSKGCIAYICKLRPKLGALNFEKCVEKGITPGPRLGQLKSGIDVTLDDGTVVKSADVCDSPIPGPVFIVIECPDENYLDSLMAHEIFQHYQKNAEDPENIANCIVHFTPDKTMNDPRYIEWMSRFPSTTQHLIINERNNCYDYEATYRIQHQLNLLHPTIFPMIHGNNPEDNVTENSDKLKSLEQLKVHRAKTLNTYHLRPLGGLEAITVTVNRERDVAEVFKNNAFLDALAELQTEINAKSQIINESPAYPKILMVGTGSCIPNKVRNTSGIMMRIDEESSILLDCGEGTAGQLIRFFGPSEIDKVFASIKAIYVSHLHADHHLGLIGVLQERKRITDEPIYLIAPKQIESWLKFFHKKFEHIEDTYILVPNKTLHFCDRKIAHEFQDELKEKLKLNDVVTIDVPHCPHAFAVAWSLQCGKTIVYSGDTRPSVNIGIIGKNCDLLIHEATFEDELLVEAKKKMHSTISEAIKVGKDIEAKFTLLTHFSQRYSKIPRLPDTDKIPDNVGIAFDNMQFSLAELSLLPLFYPALKSMFGDFCEGLEQKAQRRTMRSEREERTSKNERQISTYT